jgi:hypothetical protein
MESFLGRFADLTDEGSRETPGKREQKQRKTKKTKLAIES